jgi:hypothetical protein
MTGCICPHTLEPGARGIFDPICPVHTATRVSDAMVGAVTAAMVLGGFWFAVMTLAVYAAVRRR